MSASSRVLHFSLPLLLLTACPAGDDGDTGAGDTTTAADGTDSDSADGSSGTADTMADGTTGEPIDGEEQYLTFCAPCHGMMGEGTDLGYELQHPVRDYSSWVVRNGRPGTEFMNSVMAAYDPSLLSDAAVDAIWDYLDTFPQPTTGETLYLDYCRNCHGVDALGGVTGVNIREPGALLELPVKVREGGDSPDFAQRSLYMPAFGTDKLSDAEVTMIHDYVAGL